MANNRMYLVNKRTGARVYIAKYYPSTGWYSVIEKNELTVAFHEADFGHLNEAERDEQGRSYGLGAPHKSPAGMWGDEWVLEYEQLTEPA